MSWAIKVLATGFGAGYIPYIPGSAGTLVAIPFFLLFSSFSWPIYFLTMLALTFFAVWVSSQALPLLQDPKKPADPSSIVIDEIVGFLWALGLVRYAGFWRPDEGLFWLLFITYVFFRLFDITKWSLVGWAERKWSGGMGIVMDDVAAGIFAGVSSILFCVVTPLIVYFFASL